MEPSTITNRRTPDPPPPSAVPGVDRERFAALYADHRDELARYCRSILRHDEDVEDALQSTMAKAFAALRTETREIALRPWLFRIAHNEAISIVRRRVDAAELDDRDGGDPDVVPRTVETRERLRLLREDLRDLPERQRAALVMRELSGLGHREIADALGTSPSAVKQAIYEARCGLGDCAAGRSLTCERVRRALSDGDGRTAGQRRLRAHLRSCRSCRAFHAALRQRPQDLGALFPVWPAAGAGGLAAGLPGLLSGTGGGAAAGAASASVSVGAAGAGSGLLSGGLALAGTAKLAGIAAVAVVAGGGAVAVERGTFTSPGSGPEPSTTVVRDATIRPSTLRFAASTDRSVFSSPSASVDAEPAGRSDRGARAARGDAAGSSDRSSASRRPARPGSAKPAVPSAARDRPGRDLDRGGEHGYGRQQSGPPAHAASGTAAAAPRGPQATGARTDPARAKRSGASSPAADKKATTTASSSVDSPSGKANGTATASGGGRPAQAASPPSAGAGSSATGTSASPSGSEAKGGPPGN